MDDCKPPLAKFLGLYTEVDLNLAVHDACTELMKKEEKAYHEKLKIFAKNIEELLYKENITENCFYCVVPVFLKNNSLSWATIKIDSQKGIIEVFKPFALHERGGVLFFDLNKKEKSIFIVDIQVEIRRRGIGSCLLYLLDYIAVSANIEKITGNLSPVDASMREIQINSISFPITG